MSTLQVNSWAVPGSLSIGTDLNVGGKIKGIFTADSTQTFTTTGDINCANLTTSANAQVGGTFKVTGVANLDGDVFVATKKLKSLATSAEYADVLNKPVLSAVATSGAYGDIINKPGTVSNPQGTLVYVVNSGGTLPQLPGSTGNLLWNLNNGSGNMTFLNNAPNTATGGWDWQQFIAGAPARTAMTLSKDGTLSVLTDATVGRNFQTAGTSRLIGYVAVGDGQENNPTRALTALYPGLAAGTFKWITLGVSPSPSNTAEVGFFYAGAGSTANYLFLGLNSKPGVQISGTGAVTAPATLAVATDTSVGRNLTVTGTSAHTGTSTFTGALTASGGIATTGGTTTDTLTASGRITANGGSVTAGGANADFLAVSGVSNLNGKVTASNGINLPGVNTVNFGSDQTKANFAGTIGYATYTAGNLDIVGAGPTDPGRAIKLWDDVTVQRNLSVNGALTVNGAPVGASRVTWAALPVTPSVNLNQAEYGLDSNGFVRIRGVIQFASGVTVTAGTGFLFANLPAGFYSTTKSGNFIGGAYLANSPYTYFPLFYAIGTTGAMQIYALNQNIPGGGGTTFTLSGIAHAIN
jgi:hypothetical protein